MPHGWLLFSSTDEFHVVPVNDLVEHEPHNCVCGPKIELRIREDKTTATIHIHHSLDGREYTE